MTVDPSAEILRLRATVRDLLALSTIPEVWVGREPPAIAADLADLLIGSLELDFAFVRLCDPTGGQVVEVTRGNSWQAFPEWLQQHLAECGQFSRKEILSNVGAVEESCRGIVIPIGVNSERGLVAAASDRPDFPNQIDHQLLSVAANNAATAFQNTFLIRELRSAQQALRAHEQELRKARDELEIKVEERTAELRRSERELREVIDSIPALIHTARPDGYVDYFNQRWLQYVGLPLEDLLGWKWTAAIHPEDVEAIVEKMRSSMASGEPFLHESRVRRADGEYRWILHRKVAVRDERGQIVKWYGSSFDIEDRKRADEARRRNEFYLSEGQRLAHMGSWGFNPSGFYDYWSEELFRIYGLDPDEGPPTLEQYLACIHPEERAFMAETCGKW
jgi:PAS domain S-box-containing protein